MTRTLTTLATLAATTLMAGSALAGGPTEITQRNFNFDADYDGRITSVEYRRVIDARRDFEDRDRDFDNRIARAEFDREDRFDDYDEDRDGFLNRDEFSMGTFNDYDRDRSGDLDEMESGDLDED